MPHFEFTGIAVITELGAAINDVETNIQLDDPSGWPPGTGIKSVTATIGDTAKGDTEEKILYSSLSGDTLTVAQRGYDGTVAKSWPIGTKIRHTISAVFAAESTDHIHDVTLDQHTQYHDDSRHAAVSHTQAMLGAGSVGNEELQDGSISGPKLQNNSVVPGKVANNVVGKPQLTDDAEQALAPTGSVLLHTGSSAPAGWLLCQGQEELRSAFPDLDAHLSAEGYPYGNGDGSTTFNVPDIRQRFPLGKAASGTGAVLGETGGAIDHVHGLDTATSAARVLFDAADDVIHAQRRPGVTSWDSDRRALNFDVDTTTGTRVDAVGLQGDSDTANPPFVTFTGIIKT